MDQSTIWGALQNRPELQAVFGDSRPRYGYLAARVPSGSAALNIGVGLGGLERLLVAKGVRTSALDPSAASIEALRDSLGLGESAQVGFSQGMPFGTGQFDTVIMSEVLEHLTDEILHPTLDEVHRVLKSGGRFIGTVPANERLIDNQAVCPHCGISFHRWGHVQSFTRHSLGAVLESHLFKVQIIQIRAFPDWQRRGAINFLKSVMRYLMGRFGSPIASPHILFIAERA